jgi:hypothetical protein
MSKVLSLRQLDNRFNFQTRMDTYIDGAGYESIMKWIPPFNAFRALTNVAAPATPSNTIGDWFHPLDVPAAVLNTDYDVTSMGGYWVDQYLCSSPDATKATMGTLADGVTIKNYTSQPGVAPRVNQNIAHFKTYLAARFATGGFAGKTTATGWAGKGGLITDQHWFELWIWTRINRWFLRGNTNGYNTSNHIPQSIYDANEIGVLDGAQTSTYGASITGGGPASWEIPVSDFCGNRFEFTDGLRLYNGAVYSAGKAINPNPVYTDAAYTATGITITGVTSGQSISSYRTESAVKLHGIPSATTTAGAGGFDGQGFWITSTGEIITYRGGSCSIGAQCPGALDVTDAPSYMGWSIGARAVLVP